MSIRWVLYFLSFLLCACASPQKPPVAEPAFRLQLDKVDHEARLTSHFLKAEVYAAHNELPQAIEHYTKALHLAPQDEYLSLQLVALYLQQQSPEPAIEILQNLLAHNPQHTKAYLMLAGAHMQNKNTKKALEVYEGVLKKFPHNTEVLFHLALIYLHQGQIQKGEKFLKQVVKDSNFNHLHEAYFALAMLNRSKGEKYLPRVESYLLRGHKAKPEDEKIILTLLQFYEEQGRKKQAIKKAIEFQNQHGPSLEVARYLADIYMQDNQLDKAYQQLSWIESHDPSHLNTKIKIALILVAKQKPFQAIQKLKYVEKQNPDADRVHFYLGSLYKDTKQNQLAVEHFLKVHPKSNFYTLAVVHSSNIYFAQKSWAKASQILTQAVKERPERVELYSQLASVYVEQKKYPQAAEVLEPACEKFKTHAQMHYFLSHTYDQLDQKQKAQTYAEITLKLNPAHIGALNYLAYAWAENNQNLDQAYKMAQKAVQLQGDDPYILDTLGWVLFKQGKAQQAAHWLEKAWALKPSLSIVAQHLAEVYSQLNLNQKAHAMYQKAYQNEHDAAVRKNIQKKMDSLRQPASQ